MDMITIYCGKCGKKLEAKVVDAGGALKCAKCGVRVPIPSSNLDRAQIRIFCPKCGSRLRAWPDEGGKHVECRRCKKLISLPRIEGRDKEEKSDDTPASKPKETGRREKDDSHDISFSTDDDEKIEEKKAKAGPGKRTSKEVARPIRSADKEARSDRKERMPEPKRKRLDEDEDDDGMISFEEFLDDDASKTKKKGLFDADKEEKERRPRKPALSADDLRRARSDTDALPPAKPAANKSAAPPVAKTFVLNCRECGMRLVFKNRKPMPGATCPSCGEKLTW